MGMSLLQAMLQLVAAAFKSFDELSLAIGQCMTQEQAAFHPRGLEARQLLNKVSKHMTQEMVSAWMNAAARQQWQCTHLMLGITQWFGW